MLSICMPYWNRPRELTRSMAAYKQQYSDIEMEFSICDDGSVIPLEKQESNWTVTRLPFHAKAMNPCVPINAAVRASKHDIILLTNPEVEHREPVIRQMLAKLKSSRDYVMAACKEATTDAWIAGVEAPRAPVGGRRPIPDGSDLHFCVMFHRALFDRVGGFDESYRNGLGCEDNDFAWALQAAGARFKRIPEVVWHYRTPHAWSGTVEDNTRILEKKWGHLVEYNQCA